MKTSKIRIDGKEYTMCFSARVMRACVDRFGDLNKFDKSLMSENIGEALDTAIWMLATMMDAGARYDKLCGAGSGTAPTKDELYDLVDTTDLNEMKNKIAETITGNVKPDIETVTEKNAETSQGS